MNFNKYNGLKLPYDPVLLGDINSIDSIRDRLMREAPLAQNTGQSAYNTRGSERLQRRYRKMQSSKSPVTPRSKRTRGQPDEPQLCVFCFKDENQIPGDVFCAAGAYHAKKTKLERCHVEDLTAKLQKKAASLGENHC